MSGVLSADCLFVVLLAIPVVMTVVVVRPSGTTEAVMLDGSHVRVRLREEVQDGPSATAGAPLDDSGCCSDGAGCG